MWGAIWGAVVIVGGWIAANAVYIAIGAAVGAVIGGVTAAITGGSISKGVLFGAIGGAVTAGVGAYLAPAAGAATAGGGSVGALGMSSNMAVTGAASTNVYGTAAYGYQAAAGAGATSSMTTSGILKKIGTSMAGSQWKGQIAGAIVKGGLSAWASNEQNKDSIKANKLAADRLAEENQKNRDWKSGESDKNFEQESALRSIPQAQDNTGYYLQHDTATQDRDLRRDQWDTEIEMQYDAIDLTADLQKKRTSAYTPKSKGIRQSLVDESAVTKEAPGSGKTWTQPVPEAALQGSPTESQEEV